MPPAASPSVASPRHVPRAADLYAEHCDTVARWVTRLAGPGAHVDDLVHDVFLVALRRAGEFRGEARLSTWLFRITRRVVLEHHRKARWRRWLRPLRWGEEDPDDAPAVGPDVLEHLERAEQVRELYAALGALPEIYRTTLALFELEGLGAPEIAELTGTSVANVWIRLHRGREKLYARLARGRRGRGWER